MDLLYDGLRIQEPGYSVRVAEPIGAGGMGVVHRARYKKGESRSIDAVIKMNKDYDCDLSLQRFFRETEIMKSLDHPNVIRVYESGIHRGYPYLLLEDASATLMNERTRHYDTLADRIAQRVQEGRIKDGLQKLDAMNFCQVIDALTYVHSNGIIHRDLKPSNLFFKGYTLLKVGDFGVAKFAGESSRLSQAGDLIGTIDYMSPEQIDGADCVDAKSDQYSLGVIFYEYLTGRNPQARRESESKLVHLTRLMREPPCFDLHNSQLSVDGELSQMVLQMTAVDRNQRYSSLEIPRSLLHRKLEEFDVRMTALSRERNQQLFLNNRSKGSRAIVIASVIASCVAAGSLAYFLLQ